MYSPLYLVGKEGKFSLLVQKNGGKNERKIKK